MKSRNYLNHILNSHTLKIFTLFFNFKVGEFSGREISKMININPIVCLNNLEKLVNFKLLDKKRVGASYIFSVRKSIYWEDVIYPLILSEKKIYKRMVKEIILKFSEYSNKIIIFGSYARHEETVDSDIDICFVSKSDKRKLQKVCDDFSEEFFNSYLIHFSPYIISETEFRREKLSIIEEIKLEGKIIYEAI